MTGKTAAELIRERADSSRSIMGLTTSKSGKVQKTDVIIAKNYQFESEITELNRIVLMWLDFLEYKSRRRKNIFLKDWEEKLNAFLPFNERNVLHNAGSLSKKQADTHAETEYAKFTDQHRALLEAEGEKNNLKMLETAAKTLPSRIRKPKRTDES